MILVIYCYNIYEMDFYWDDLKDSANKKKHGVSFAEAATAFQNPDAIELFDDDHSEKEERWILVGHSAKNRILLVVFVEKSDDAIRIISARKAQKSEINQYYSKVKK